MLPDALAQHGRRTLDVQDDKVADIAGSVPADTHAYPAPHERWGEPVPRSAHMPPGAAGILHVDSCSVDAEYSAEPVVRLTEEQSFAPQSG